MSERDQELSRKFREGRYQEIREQIEQEQRQQAEEDRRRRAEEQKAGPPPSGWDWGLPFRLIGQFWPFGR